MDPASHAVFLDFVLKSFGNSNSSWEQEFAAWAEQQIALLVSVAQQKRALNAALPISRLPPEILVEIFIHCQDDRVCRSGSFRASWLSVTWVCHHWRKLALGTPLLWSKVYISRSHKFRDPEAFPTYLARSKQVPLEIDINLDKQDTLFSDLENFCFPKLCRARSLSLSLPYDMHQGFFSHIPPSAPLLTSLSLSVQEDPSIRYGRIAPTPLEYRWVTPSLKKLLIGQYPINWTRTTLPNTLTFLCVCSDRPASVDSCSVADMVRIVGAMPCLEYLKLEEILAPIHDGIHEASTSVALPHLQYAYISSHIHSCLHFLHHFTYPPSADLELFTDFDNMLDISLLVTPLRAIVQRADREPALTVVVSPTEMCLFAPETSSPGSPSTSQTRFLSLRVQGPYFSDDEVLCNILSKLSLHDVSDLRLQGNICHKDERDGWIQWLRRMPNIKSLVIEFSEHARDPISSDFLTLLEPLDPSVRSAHMPHGPDPVVDGTGPPARSGSDSCLMPLLRTLSVEGIEFREGVSGNEEIWDEDSAVLERLHVVLKWRNIVGYGLETVIIDNCSGLDGEDLEPLRSIVTVEWDGSQEICPW
ncbi:hypothetical protein BXZ70DRAFT_690340 [Cristinia sonorae]|uniref:F-box domain-containing protein n=1 Tax=Cristinia sonorae TaxID=1940300 RepID=A0A8K0UDJ1_9AGAR|nr:hypothetical protein BXZ70DRAFT_690340 [Cristinia sonorae]